MISIHVEGNTLRKQISMKVFLGQTPQGQARMAAAKMNRSRSRTSTHWIPS